MQAMGRKSAANRLTNPPQATTMKELSLPCGPVAQLGARFHGMEEVVGSIPTRSTKILDYARR